jgi:hypothetical protein
LCYKFITSFRGTEEPVTSLAPSFQVIGLLRIILTIQIVQRFFSTLYGEEEIIAGIEEDIMVEISESAAKQIAAQLKDIEVSAIRIFLDQGG